MSPPTLFIVCGLPASGKTIVSRRLESRRHALRVTPDEWMARIVGDGWDQAGRAQVEAVMSEIAARLLELGTSVVLDFGCWTKAERDSLRRVAHARGARAQTHYCIAELSELQVRLTARNAQPPQHTFTVTPPQVAEMHPHFQPRQPGETDDGGEGG